MVLENNLTIHKTIDKLTAHNPMSVNPAFNDRIRNRSITFSGAKRLVSQPLQS